jgi:ubiquinone/menaquinone biosynthesis C-methylase UbiE
MHAVEPNGTMRETAEAHLGGAPRFHSVKGRAEATRLADRKVDAVTAGQAFHWFAADETRTEFVRILRPGGTVALFWNTRLSEGTPFLSAYEQLLPRFETDYLRVSHPNVGAPQSP